MRSTVFFLLCICGLFHLTNVEGTIVEIPLVAVVFAAQQVYNQFCSTAGI